MFIKMASRLIKNLYSYSADQIDKFLSKFTNSRDLKTLTGQMQTDFDR